MARIMCTLNYCEIGTCIHEILNLLEIHGITVLYEVLKCICFKQVQKRVNLHILISVIVFLTSVLLILYFCTTVIFWLRICFKLVLSACRVVMLALFCECWLLIQMLHWDFSICVEITSCWHFQGQQTVKKQCQSCTENVSKIIPISNKWIVIFTNINALCYFLSYSRSPLCDSIWIFCNLRVQFTNCELWTDLIRTCFSSVSCSNS